MKERMKKNIYSSKSKFKGVDWSTQNKNSKKNRKIKQSLLDNKGKITRGRICDSICDLWFTGQVVLQIN